MRLHFWNWSAESFYPFYKKRMRIAVPIISQPACLCTWKHISCSKYVQKNLTYIPQNPRAVFQLTLRIVTSSQIVKQGIKIFHRQFNNYLLSMKRTQLSIIFFNYQPVTNAGKRKQLAYGKQWVVSNFAIFQIFITVLWISYFLDILKFQKWVTNLLNSHLLFRFFVFTVKK